MKPMRWVLLVLGALVALLLLAAGGVYYLVSRLDVRAEVERAVEGATGRDLTIAGDVGVAFWPVLGLRAEQITLANVEGGRAPALVAADEIDIGVEIRPLFERQVVVRRLVLQSPRIALEVDGQGAPNWIMTSPAPPPGSTPPPPPRPAPSGEPAIDVNQTRLREVRIEHGEVSFFDARQSAGWVIGDVNLRTALTALDEPMRIEGALRYNDRPIELDMEIAHPGAAFRGEPTGLKLEVETELLNADFDGQTTAASGELAGLIHASGPSLRQLAAWSGAPLQGGVGFENFNVSGRLSIGGGRYEFSNAGFGLDRISGRGDFVLSQLRGKPYLSGRLELFDFDFNPYLSGQTPAPASAAETAAAPASGETPAPTAEIAVVEAGPRALDVQQAPSGTPIDFSGLQAFNADLELVTHAVLVQHMRIDSGRLNMVLNDGYLAATLHEIALYGGSGRGRLEIDARTPDTRMVQDLAFYGVDARSFLTDAINFGNIEGRAELSLRLRTQGRTQTELIANADGATHLEVISGALRGVDLGGVSRTIRNALRGELIAPEARTPFNGFSATFAVADGVLASENVSFNTPDLRIPGLAVIDLPARRLDVRLAPRAQGGGIVFPFSVRGPFDNLAYNHDIGDRAQREIRARVREVQTASRVN